MRIYIGFDDTDNIHSDRGTGKLARWFKTKIPGDARLAGILRQQLPQWEGIPFTSKNSAACIILETENPEILPTVIEAGCAHIHEHFIDGSDPGLCVVSDQDTYPTTLVEFGKTCSSRIVTQQEAMRAAADFHLSGHGGTNDGIIGAAAGVGLTIYGWVGRYIDFEGLRTVPQEVSVGELEKQGIVVLPLERNAMVPGYDDIVETGGKLRPRLWGGRPAVPVTGISNQRWDVVGKKKPDISPRFDRIAV
ncbi:MAG: hypothetical protein GY866_23830 [Proteobacteria bacterium]|nr:hypothetical protein [Pseudomonadota bacterium]